MAPRRRRVVWTERARNALDEAIAHVAADSPDAAERLLIRILDVAKSLDRLTDRGRMVPELQDGSIRELITPPYRLIFDHDDSEVRILALVHDAQEFHGRDLQ